MLLDIFHLARSLRRSPAGAAAAVLTLTLTIGVSTSIFAVVHAVRLPPPFRDPGALVLVGETPRADPAAPLRAVPHQTFESWRAEAGQLASLEAFDGTNVTATGIGPAERVSTTDVTTGFLDLLGVEVVLGRGFTPADAARPVVLVSHAMWRDLLGGDPSVAGRPIVLGGQPHTIVGVLPESFRFELDRGDIWRPLPVDAAEAARIGYRVRVLARLAPGATPEMLSGALDTVSRRAAPPARAITVGIREAISGRADGMLRVLSAAAAVALLIAFVNLASLLVVRTIDRRRELAVRRALGCGAAGFSRQLLIESHALVAAGVLAGSLLAVWLTPLLADRALEQFAGPAGRETGVAWRVVVLIAIASWACAWLCGFAPVAAAMGGSDGDVLRSRIGPAARSLRWRRALVAGQLAVAFVLLATGAILGRSLLALLDVNPGFDPAGVVAMQVALPSERYPDAERVAAFYGTARASLRERLGSPVAIVDEIPLSGDGGRVLVRPQPRSEPLEAVVRTASADYFETMAIPLVDGRTFTDADAAGASRRVVISETAARALFAGGRAAGRLVWLAGADAPAEVVGVVGDVAHRVLDERRLPTVYVSSLQLPSPRSIIVVRSERSIEDVVRITRQAIARFDGDLPVYAIRPMTDVVDASPGIPARRILSAASGGLAGLAILLSAIGLFGLAAHDVASRRGEIALRAALGADATRIVRAVVGQSLPPLAAGLLTGGLLSLWSRGLLASAGFPPGGDTASPVLAALFLTIVSALAVLPAAVRAARTDPRDALAGG